MSNTDEMEYTLEINHVVNWEVYFKGTQIVRIIGGNNSHTPGSPYWTIVKNYVENLIVDQLSYE